MLHNTEKRQGQLLKKRSQAVAELQRQQVGPRLALHASCCSTRARCAGHYLLSEFSVCSRSAGPAQAKGLNPDQLASFLASVSDADRAIAVRLAATNHPNPQAPHSGPACQVRSSACASVRRC